MPTAADLRSAGAGSVRTLQAVLFDMDGLLVNTEPLWFEVEREVMARLGGDWTEQDQQALVGGSLHGSVGYLLERATRPASREQVGDWLIGGMAALLAEREVAAMPGALALLAEVEAAGLPRALVTSSERVIMDAVLGSLARQGVTFSVTVCGADVRRPKPHPEPYQRAAALTGADPRCCVALEDSPTGLASAEAAGCTAVVVPGVAPVSDGPGRTVVSSLTEVDVELLRSLVVSVCGR
ncbi:MAG TPA: HAD family phosphatase [Streptosporangiaceae bacterium]